MSERASGGADSVFLSFLVERDVFAALQNIAIKHRQSRSLTCRQILRDHVIQAGYLPGEESNNADS